MGTKIWISEGHCCGALCAYVLRGNGEWRWADDELASEHDDGDLYQAYLKAASDSPEEQIAEFDSWYASAQKMLTRLVASKEITQGQADAAVAEWLLKNPNPHLENAG